MIQPPGKPGPSTFLSKPTKKDTHGCKRPLVKALKGGFLGCSRFGVFRSSRCSQAEPRSYRLPLPYLVELKRGWLLISPLGVQGSNSSRQLSGAPENWAVQAKHVRFRTSLVIFLVSEVESMVTHISVLPGKNENGPRPLQRFSNQTRSIGGASEAPVLHHGAHHAGLCFGAARGGGGDGGRWGEGGGDRCGDTSILQGTRNNQRDEVPLGRENVQPTWGGLDHNLPP